MTSAESHPQAQFSALERAVAEALERDDEGGLDPHWAQAFDAVAGLVGRPGKRVRPMLVLTGFQIAAPGRGPTEAVQRFAAAQELLHAFMLIHDDVADRASTRRGGATLHQLLAPAGDERLGEQLAIVAGDHLFALAIERMLGSGGPHVGEATSYALSVCRHTAVGQFLDLKHARTPLSQLTLWDTMRVAQLKTARYGFVAPLVCGAMLGGAPQSTLDALARAGRHAGIAYQLRDDLIGLFGDARLAGKSCAGDYLEGKRTFPVIASWTRAGDAGRAELERLWDLPSKSEADCEDARAWVLRSGGAAATERVIERCTRAALKTIATLPAGPARAQLQALVSKLAHRTA